MKRLSVILMFAALLLVSCGQPKVKEIKVFTPDYVTTPEDSALISEIVLALRTEANSREDVTTPELMMAAGRRLLGNEYVAGTLDSGEKEVLTLYVLKTDCILFVEACTNLARAAVDPVYPEHPFYSYAANVLQTRYRDGRTDTYSDRIHYTTEWLRHAQANGILDDKTLEFGGKVYDHPIGFMSNNIKYYKQLADAETDPRAAHDLEIIRKVENTLNEAPQYYIPDGEIKKAEPFLQTGDIIGYMSTTPGLDIAHVAMVYVTDINGNAVYGDHDDTARVGFIHASMAQMKVIIDPLTIADYVASRDYISGICVARVK